MIGRQKGASKISRPEECDVGRPHNGVQRRDRQMRAEAKRPRICERQNQA
jgi:hypothetical protein